ncbi:hypothetical protein AAVH_41098 [Aphelenchoides avenae]|nr:hypothetical protein AAVH_41098 [Aphelenchus avenae]
MRGNNSSRGSRGRGYVMKRPTAATRSSDLAPEFPDTDPPAFYEQSETAETPTEPEPEAQTDQQEAAATPTIAETSDAETTPVYPAQSIGTASVTISIPPG